MVTATPPKHDRAQLRLVQLDGLRGIAAIAVLFYHMGVIRHAPGLFTAGYVAVDLFFMLSGFVLTLAFDPKFNSGLGLLRFMRLRALRLWPVLTLGVLLGALGETLFFPNALILPLIVLTLVMLPVGMGASGLYYLNPVQWSLLYELIANAVHAAVLHRLSDRWILAIGLACGAVFGGAIVSHGNADFGSAFPTLLLGLPRAGFGYCLGVWLARRWHGVDAVVTSAWWLWMIAPVIAIASLGLVADNLAGASLAVTICLVLPLLFARLITVRVPEAAEPALDWLGRLSYPLYAVHFPILLALQRTDHALRLDIPEPLWTLLALAAVLGAAQLVTMAGPRWQRRGQAAATPSFA